MTGSQMRPLTNQRKSLTMAAVVVGACRRRFEVSPKLDSHSASELSEQEPKVFIRVMAVSQSVSQSVSRRFEFLCAATCSGPAAH